MKNFKTGFVIILVGLSVISGCASMKKSTKGAAIGTAAGGAMGAIIGAAVGGATGAVIGNKMDKQAAEIKNTVPDAKVERVGEGIVVEFSSNVLFAFDKSDLTSDSESTLDKLVTVLNKYPDTNIELQGHTDNAGSDKYNQSLSERRARSVSKYLKNKGIASKRMTVKGFGETVPKYDNSTEQGRSRNRRVEFLITANEIMKAEAEKEAGNK